MARIAQVAVVTAGKPTPIFHIGIGLSPELVPAGVPNIIRTGRGDSTLISKARKIVIRTATVIGVPEQLTLDMAVAAAIVAARIEETPLNKRVLADLRVRVLLGQVVENLQLREKKVLFAAARSTYMYASPSIKVDWMKHIVTDRFYADEIDIYAHMHAMRLEQAKTESKIVALYYEGAVALVQSQHQLAATAGLHEAPLALILNLDTARWTIAWDADLNSPVKDLSALFEDLQALELQDRIQKGFEVAEDLVWRRDGTSFHSPLGSAIPQTGLLQLIGKHLIPARPKRPTSSK